MDCARKKGHFFTLVLFFITVLLMISVSSAEDTQGDWFITLGMGAFHEPEYEGSDKAETMASLDFEVVWKDRVFLNPDGLGINYYRKDSLVLNAIISKGDERKDSLSDNLNGLGELNASTTLTLGAEFEIGPFLSYANLTSHVGGTNGVEAIVGLQKILPLQIITGNPDGPLVFAGLSADWADTNYTDGFFGVDAKQSARSGLPQYTAKAGFRSINLDLSAIYHVNKSWSAHGFSGYRKLIGDAEDSPIVRDDDHIYVGGIITYKF